MTHGTEGPAADRYILGYGVAAGWNHKNEGYHFYHLDEQNSTTYITGMEGEIVNCYQYDAFGVITNRQEGFDNRILYTGQQYDPITEQYYWGQGIITRQLAGSCRRMCTVGTD